MSVRRRTSVLVVSIVLCMVVFVQLLPILIALMNAFRENADIMRRPFGFPEQFRFDNFVNAWNTGSYGKAFLNSLSISIPVSVAVLACSIISGFFLARVRSRLGGFLQAYYGVALSISLFSYMVPLYYTFSQLDLVNSRIGMILIFIAVNLPFNILLARTYIYDIPVSIDEAATIDGASTYQIIGSIILPLSKPIATTILLIVFISTWNEFTLANTFLQRPELKTAATKYVLFVGERGSDISLVYTAGIITTLPIIIAFLLLQNYFIEGMTSGSIK